MSDKFYVNLNGRIHNNEKLTMRVIIASKLSTASVYIGYFLMLIILCATKNYAVLRIETAFPLGGFIGVTIFRALVNSPRPYEKMNILPLKASPKKGKSFPSRHTFSAFIIAFFSFYASVFAGVLFTVAAAAVAVSRVLCGVHYIKDVTAGILSAFAIYAVALFLI